MREREEEEQRARRQGRMDEGTDRREPFRIDRVARMDQGACKDKVACRDSLA